MYLRMGITLVQFTVLWEANYSYLPKLYMKQNAEAFGIHAFPNPVMQFFNKIMCSEMSIVAESVHKNAYSR